MKSVSRWIGPAWVAAAALLWGTDAVFRTPVVRDLNPIWMVFIEHLLGTLAFLPWVWMNRAKLFKLKFLEWAGVICIGGGGSALATVLFTASFQYINPSIAILLQKLQPVFVAAIAMVFLNERPTLAFFGWGSVALFFGIGVSFPDYNFSFLENGLDRNSVGVIYALLAAGLWGISTVVGKALLSKVSVGVTTFWRFFFGTLVLGALVQMAPTHPNWVIFLDRELLIAVIYMALLPGVLGVYLYYQGLSRTTASVATFVELLFPLSAVVLNAVFLESPLSPMQLVYGIGLIGAILMLSRYQTQYQKKGRN